MEKRNKQRNFRPSPANAKRLDIASRLGLNVSELINEVLEERLDYALNQKSRALVAELKMVRGGGFEPPTPTVSR